MPRRAKKAAAGSEGKRYPLNIRTTFELRRDLERAASNSGRSLAQEAETRLEISLARKDQIEAAWGWDIYPVFHSLALALWQIEQLTGKRWWEDEKTRDLFERTAAKLIENYGRIISQDLLEFEPRSLRLSLDQPPDELVEAVASRVGIGPSIGPKEDKAKRAARKAHALKEARARMASSGARPLIVDREEP